MNKLDLHASAILEADHHRMDAGFATFMKRARAGTVATDTITPAIEAMRRHLWVEEEYFFPALEEAGVVGPVKIMLREHGEIWNLLDELERLLALPSPHPDMMLTVCSAIMQISAQHNFKEENILFATADQFLDSSIGRRIEEGLRMERPSGWVSEMARD